MIMYNVLKNIFLSLLLIKQLRNPCFWSFCQCHASNEYDSLLCEKKWHWKQSPLIANIAQIIVLMHQNIKLKMSELERSNSIAGIFLSDTNWYFCISNWLESLFWRWSPHYLAMCQMFACLFFLFVMLRWLLKQKY